MPSALDIADLGYSNGVVVTDAPTFWIVTMGKLQVILAMDSG